MQTPQRSVLMDKRQTALEGQHQDTGVQRLSRTPQTSARGAGQDRHYPEEA